MAVHSGIRAWEISWTEEPAGLLQLRGSKTVRHDSVTRRQHTAPASI